MSNNLVTVAGLAGILLATGCTRDPQFELKFPESTSGNVADFGSDSDDSDVTIFVYDSDGDEVDDAECVWFDRTDGDKGELFHCYSPSSGLSGLDVYEHNSSHDLSLTSNNNIPWLLERSRNRVLHDTMSDFGHWSAYSDQLYLGCSTYAEMKEGRELASLVFSTSKKLAPVAWITSITDSIQTSLETLLDSELIDQSDIETDCWAIQYFSFTGFWDEGENMHAAIGSAYCVAEPEVEVSGNGIDDDCDGIVDENGGSDTDDTWNDDTGNPNTTCTGLEYLCDDFENGSLASFWNTEGDVSETYGMMVVGENSEVSADFEIDLTTVHDYSFLLLTEIVSGEDYKITVTNNDWGWAAIEHRNGSMYATCSTPEGLVQGDSVSLPTGTRNELELSVSDSYTYAFVNGNSLFGQEDCWSESSGNTDELEFVVTSRYGAGPELEYITIVPFSGL